MLRENGKSCSIVLHSGTKAILTTRTDPLEDSFTVSIVLVMALGG